MLVLVAYITKKNPLGEIKFERVDEIRIVNTLEKMPDTEDTYIYRIILPEKYSSKLDIPHSRSEGWRELARTALNAMRFADDYDKAHSEKDKKDDIRGSKEQAG